MSPSLATFILLSGYLISSSASSLARIKLSLEKLSMTKSLAASPIGTKSLDTTALTGYIAVAAYSDTSCGTPLTVDFTALDTCYPGSTSTYTSVTATSTTLTVGEYSDSLCKTVISETELQYTDGLCGDGAKIFASATSTFTSSVSMFSTR
jgi:hypothetical protein